MTIALKSGDTAWGWKVAYEDEAYADSSPGVLAVVGLTETMLADPAIAQANSCATATDTMAPQLWKERLTLADCLFTASANGNFLSRWRRGSKPCAARRSPRRNQRVTT